MKKRVLFLDGEPNILDGLQRMPHPARKTAESVTVSAGMAVGPAAPWERAVKEADEALYAAKNRAGSSTGRDGAPQRRDERAGWCGIRMVS